MTDQVVALTGKSNSLTPLTEEDKKKIVEITETINMKDLQNLLQYGVGAQAEISVFADSVLSQVRAKDSGHVGKILTELMLKVEDMDVNSLTGQRSFLANLPIVGDLINAGKRFVAKYEKLNVEIERIADALENARMQLLKDLTMMDKMYEINLGYLHQLDLYIAAGDQKLTQVQAQELPVLKAKADTTKDMIVAQEYTDLMQAVNRFEKKLHDLKLSRTIALQTVPQIRLVQNNDQVLVEKIQGSLLHTLPLWKNQVVIAIALFRQKQALESQRQVAKTTNDLLLKNAELLKTNSIEVAKEGESGIVAVETLKKVNDDLIATIDSILQIQKEGHSKRQQAEQELVKIEQELKRRLTTPA